MGVQRTIVLAIAATVAAGRGGAVTIVGGGYDAPIDASGWLDPGSGVVAASPDSIGSRGAFGFVIMPAGNPVRFRFGGDAGGLISSTRTLVTYTLYDLDALPASTATPSAAPPGAASGAPSPDLRGAVPTASPAAVYADAGSGTVLGTATLAPTVPVVVELNAAGIAALDAAAAASRPFLVGVTIGPPAAGAATAPGKGPGSVPEPATWLLEIGGLGLIGAALRRSRRDGSLVA